MTEIIQGGTGKQVRDSINAELTNLEGTIDSPEIVKLVGSSQKYPAHDGSNITNSVASDIGGHQLWLGDKTEYGNISHNTSTVYIIKEEPPVVIPSTVNIILPVTVTDVMTANGEVPNLAFNSIGAFDNIISGVNVDWQTPNSAGNPWITYSNDNLIAFQFPTPTVVNGYGISDWTFPNPYNGNNISALSSFTFMGYSGGNWMDGWSTIVELDSRTEIAALSEGDCSIRRYYFNNTTAYDAYVIYINGWTYGSPIQALNEIEMYYSH